MFLAIDCSEQKYYKPKICMAWWRHQMETLSTLLALCVGNSPVTGEFTAGQWRGALVFSLICVWINDWVNNRETGDLRCHRGHYDVTVMGDSKLHGELHSSPPGQNGRHFAEDIFKHIFMNEKFCILTWIKLKLVAKGPINNKSALVRVTAWRRTGDKSLP